jgi:hypothetical protein
MLSAERIREIQNFLAAWTGAYCQLWEYTATHQKLTIRFHRSGVRGNGHLACIGCTRIDAPVSWSGFAGILVEPSDNSQSYQIVEPRVGARIEFTHAQVELDVAPLY